MIFNIKLLLLINHKYNFILYYLIVFLYMYFNIYDETFSAHYEIFLYD